MSRNSRLAPIMADLWQCPVKLAAEHLAIGQKNLRMHAALVTIRDLLEQSKGAGLTLTVALIASEALL